MADVKKLAEELTKLTVLEVNELKNVLKEEYGIEPAAAAAAYRIPGRFRSDSSDLFLSHGSCRGNKHIQLFRHYFFYHSSFFWFIFSEMSYPVKNPLISAWSFFFLLFIWCIIPDIV